MHLEALRAHATDSRPRHDLPALPQQLACAQAQCPEGLVEVVVLTNGARSRFWLIERLVYADVKSIARSAETQSYTVVKGWLAHYDLHEMSIGGTVIREGRCPIERVAKQPAGAEVRTARREMMAH